MYTFDLTPSGQNTITFTITDVYTQESYVVNTWHFTVPNTNMLYRTNLFSPASAIEGASTNTEFTSVPTFDTYLSDADTGITTHWTWASDSIPLGIGTKTWGSWYWSMLYQYYVSSYVSTTAYGYGAVNNPNGLVGNHNNGDYVQLWGGNYGDGGSIVGWMDKTASGHIYLYGYSGSGYYTHLYTFVSYNNNNDWTQTSVQTVYGDGSGPHWIDCGSASNFRYIAIAAIDDNGMSANIFIDSVQVTT